MTHASSPELRVLHAVRVLGFADTDAIADRSGVDHDTTTRRLREAEDHGWVQHTSFFGTGGWSLTEEGKTENEHQLAQERAAADRGGVIRTVYEAFLPLNARLVGACTDWQIRLTDDDPFAVNDHADPVWDTRILDELGALHTALAPLVGRLASVLARFEGYDTRFEHALARARSGEHAWVDTTDVDSCHRVWFQLHEDLLATLGIHRGGEA